MIQNDEKGRNMQEEDELDFGGHSQGCASLEAAVTYG